MKPGWAIRTMATGGALALALSGCGGGKDEAAANPARNVPAGGWPQPENGRLTAKMCGLLTDADYAKYGHERMPQENAGPAQDGSNAVSCMYMLGDELTLSLQKSAQGAQIAFRQGLDEHRDRLKTKKTVLASHVVQGADESWFDYATLGVDVGEYEVQARRGALTVGIVLAGDLKAPDKDPKGELTGLASLVLQRIPDVGKTDTGLVHQVKYVVTGSGPAATQIVYNDPVSRKTITVKKAGLPWHKEFPMPDTGNQPTAALTVNAVSGTPTGMIGCEILIDGKPADQHAPSMGGAFCDSEYRS